MIESVSTNCTLDSKNQKLHKLKDKAESKVLELEALVVKKEENLRIVTAELERTQKAL